MTFLTHVNLSNNQFQEFPSSLLTLKLTLLDLGKNRLQAIPQQIG